MGALAIAELVGLLARVTSGALTALEINATERLPALRAHADAIEQMVAEGRDPTQDEVDALAMGINDDIAAIQARADEARGLTP